MSHGYLAVSWNPMKKRYDRLLLLAVGLYLLTFCATGLLLHPEVTAETLILRGLATCAFALLHLILCIGPLCRLDPRFLPLLYNRRHLGVTMFGLALGHGSLALFQFHALGNLNPFVSVLVSNTRFGSLAQFPFELFGILALAILFLMAATSHDFWLANLTAPVWKALHMGVYLAYAALVLHVVLGVLQAEASPVYTGALFLGMGLVFGLQLAAAFRSRPGDREARPSGFLDACAVLDLPEGRAQVVCLAGERVAIFRNGDRVQALSSVCQHQNGPLGEGCIRDGLVTCPWHGYQYQPEDGASPPPFTEKVPTFNVRLEAGRVLVDPVPNPAGTPASFGLVASPAAPEDRPFFVGYLEMPTSLARFLKPRILGLLAAAALLGALLAAPQRPFGPGRFDFGHSRRFTGVVVLEGYPSLLLEQPQAAPGQPVRSRFLLVGEGKHGAGPRFQAMAGQRVQFLGTLIQRDGLSMIEVVADTLEVLGQGPGPRAATCLGSFTLRGEIVDSKCFLGVMKPGNLKPHKACAIRCISGGVPPVLVVRDGQGRALYLVLEGAAGQALNEEVLPFVAEPVELTGSLERREDLWVLRVPHGGIRSID